MILRVVSAEVCGPHHLSLTFSDGTGGVADVGTLLYGPVFEPLREAGYFARAKLDRVCGTVVWPNGADIAPEAMRALVGAETIA
ncbi:MAG TPA: DUF2442 domain-containing protein [Planctomycetales bacterium]|jgi:hypothetical protein|nr:DUF2442 domain-containing protein [Planctomycetales bacterium]